MSTKIINDQPTIFLFYILPGPDCPGNSPGWIINIKSWHKGRYCYFY